MEDQQYTEVLYYSNSLPHLLLQVNTDRIHSGLRWILLMLHFQSNKSISFFLFSALLHLQFCNHNIHDINIYITTLNAYACMRTQIHAHTHTHTHTHTHAQTHAQTHEHMNTHRKIINSAHSVQKNCMFLILFCTSLLYSTHIMFCI